MEYVLVIYFITVLLMLMTLVYTVQRFLVYNVWLIDVLLMQVNGGLMSALKSQCICAGYKPDCFVTTPRWFVNDAVMDTVTKLYILGVTFNNNGKTYEHVQNVNVGLSIPSTISAWISQAKTMQVNHNCIDQYIYQHLHMAWIVVI